MFYRLLLVEIFFCFTCSVIYSEENPSAKENALTKGVEKREKAKTEKEINELINQLVSPNPKPITGDEDARVTPDYELPKGFDKEKQKTVRAARFELTKIGPQAFPYLYECIDDKRYCITISIGVNGYCKNQSVGETCRAIIYDQLQPYGLWSTGEGDPRERSHRPSYPEHIVTKNWCEKNKNRSLYDLQLEAIDWIISEEAKSRRKYTDQERKELQALRQELIKNKKFEGYGNYFNNDIEF